MEVNTEMSTQNISDQSSKPKNGITSKIFAVQVTVQFNYEQLKFILLYNPLQLSEVNGAVSGILKKNVGFNVETHQHKHLNFLKLKDEGLCKLFTTCLEYGKLSKPEQLFSATKFVFKMTIEAKRDVVLKANPNQDRYQLVELMVHKKRLKFTHAL